MSDFVIQCCASSFGMPWVVFHLRAPDKRQKDKRQYAAMTFVMKVAKFCKIKCYFYPPFKANSSTQSTLHVNCSAAWTPSLTGVY